MIIARIQGGLGNQMFQYVIGYQLATINNVEFKIDITMFSTYKWHKYSLSPFSINESFASLEEISNVKEIKQNKVKKIISKLVRSSPKLAPTHIKENYFHYNPDILELPDGIYLDGYWQSEKYFKNIESIVRQMFTVKNPQKGKDKEIAQIISSCQSVCLHIRRGNYVTDKTTNEIHGTCDLNYYMRCIDLITTKVENPHFFVFSNDHEWVRKNLKLDYLTTYVDHNNDEKDYEDLRLMSQCKHHIIANSTFSWWSAWLCNNPNKLVCAPQKWFAIDKYNIKDLLPSNWFKL